LVMTAILHDIMKLDTATININTTYITSPGHEKAAADLIIDNFQVQDWIRDNGADFGAVLFVVRYHMRMKTFDDMSGKKQNELKRQQHFKLLHAFRYADSMLISDTDAIFMMNQILK